MSRWSFAIDVGGTFTDCVATRPDGSVAVAKVLSSDDAPLVAIREIAGEVPIGCEIRLGTTKGTNALLTRRGARVALLVTRGFGDLLEIGTQDRPALFALDIVKRAPLAEWVVEVDERVAVDGTVLRAPDEGTVRAALRELRAAGAGAVAVLFLHAHAFPAHERLVGAWALAEGFGAGEVSVSSEVAPLEKMVWRGDTTVLDAYLTPVLSRYLARLPDGVRVMTSAGGLVDASRFRGRDSVLSGPAGGVVGAAEVARRHGVARAIAFDMGGTSTDVSRIDGEPEIEFETVKAGVRVFAPMLAIDTVAAGGGSICGFDGVKLVVGPASAGADPGPACYGRGGPFTITDANLVLGRLDPARFPFALDESAARARLDELAGVTGMSPDALARGFVEVANAVMARAMRRVTVTRGADPRDHVLVCFGGAGAQHACALATELGVDEVIVPALASVLSAAGIGAADLRCFREESVLTGVEEAELEARFGRLEAAAASEIRAQGAAEVNLRRLVAVRYRGQDAALSVAGEGEGGECLRSQFEREHRRVYGFDEPHRPLEVVAVRVDARGTLTRWPTTSAGGTGEERVGPALWSFGHTTVVVESGWVARETSDGDLRMTRHAPPASAGVGGPVPHAADDPVALELYNHRFAAVAEDMGHVLRRTATSTNVKERLDYSCALFDADAHLIVNAPHIPVHLGAMSETVRALHADHPDLRPGDILVSNDPYRGGSHLPDVTVVTPIFADEPARLVAFVASRAHHAEIGGILPGSMPPFSRSLDEEGVVIRSFLLARAGDPRWSAMRELLASGPYPSRNPDENLADLRAQVAANRAGVRGFEALAARHGLAEVLAFMAHVQTAAATKMRQALSRLGDGARRFVDHLDDGTPIAVTVTVTGDTATLDFTGTGPQVAGNLNANQAIVTAAVLYCLRCLIDEDIPLNTGVLEPITLVVPDGSVLRPRPGAAVVGGNVETSQRVVDVILGALGLAAASQGTMNNLTFGDERSGYYETIAGGAGATPRAPGAHAVHTHMTNTRMTDPEVLERRAPVRVTALAVRRGSGGAGRHPGGDGVIRELEALAPLSVSLLTERRGPYAPYGLAGGAPGALGRNLLLTPGEPPQPLPARHAFTIRPGQRLRVETPGGGGYGPAEPNVTE